MKLDYLLGSGAALLTLSLHTAAFAQTSPADTNAQPQPQPQPPGYPMQPTYPPQPAYPPQPGQPMPMYGYPPGTPLPPNYYQPQVAPPPPQIVGYRSQPRIGLIVGGSVTLGVMWLITAGSGAALQASCDAGFSGSSSSSGGCSSTYWPLYIPVIGPFIQMGYVPNDSSRSLAMLGLAFDGFVQTGGLVMLILGATLRERVPVYAQKVQVAPMFTSAGSGLALFGRF